MFVEQFCGIRRYTVRLQTALCMVLLLQPMVVQVGILFCNENLIILQTVSNLSKVVYRKEPP